jgi:hypothetical protein
MARMMQRLSAPRMVLAADRPAPEKGFGLAVFLYFLAVVLPSELEINLAGLALIPVRIVLLALFIPAAARLLATTDFRPQAFDYLLLLGLAWLVFALSVNNGAEKGIKYGGSLAVEAVGGYLIARAYIRNYRQFAKAVGFYFFFLLIVAAIAIPETFFAVRFVHPMAAQLTGSVTTKMVEAGRMGLERASSSFDHPILYGVFCASSFGLVWHIYGARRDIWIRVAAIVFAAFCAVSSAALLAIAVGATIIAWERWTRPFRQRTAITLALMAVAYLTLELLSNRTMVEVLIGFVALDPWTAYYRVLIWQNAFVDLVRSPLVGVAFDAWTRPAWMTTSVDSFWLVIALSAGLPTIAMIATMIVLLLRRVHASAAAGETQERRAARFGWTVAVLALCFQAFTVHYWGSMNSFFFFILGMGAWLTDSASDRKSPEKSAGEAARAEPLLLRRGTILTRQPRAA